MVNLCNFTISIREISSSLLGCWRLLSMPMLLLVQWRAASVGSMARRRRWFNRAPPPVFCAATRASSLVQSQLGLGQGSTISVAKMLLKKEGIYALSKGFTASILKQGFSILQQHVSVGMVKEVLDPIKDPFYQAAVQQLTTSAFGAFVCSPFDLAFVRMQADSVLPLAQRRHYKDGLRSVLHIAADDGVLGLWKGAGLSVAKAMAASLGMLATYERTKAERTGPVKDPVSMWGMFEYRVPRACSFPKLIGATILAAGLSAPIDFLKTQIQSQPGNEKLFYAGAVDCAQKLLKAGGFMTFYRGFPAYYVRLAVPTVVSWTFVKVVYGDGV